MRKPACQFRSGVTLIEVMLAASILALAALTLFEGIGVCSRIIHENAQFLVADAFAHDLAWKRAHESYAALNTLVLSRNGSPLVENLSSNAVPALWRTDAVPQSRTTFTWPRNASGAEEKNGVVITVDVEWGPARNRRSLSTAAHPVQAFVSGIGREDG